MPLVDISDKAIFHRQNDIGTGIYLIKGQIYIPGDKAIYSKASERKEVRLQLHRKVCMAFRRGWAEKLVAALGLKSGDVVALIGATFGWTAEEIEKLVPGITVVCVDTSSWVASAKGETELAEIEAVLADVGILPVMSRYGEVMARLHDGGMRARRAIENEDIATGKGRANLKNKYGNFTHAVTDNVLPWLTDAEAVDLDAAMHKLAPNVAHQVSVYDHRYDDKPEPFQVLNWKHLLPRPWAVFDLRKQDIWLRYETQAEAEAEVSRLHALTKVDPDTGETVPVYSDFTFEARNIPEVVKSELTDQSWYTMSNWKSLLNADSVLVGV